MPDTIATLTDLIPGPAEDRDGAALRLTAQEHGTLWRRREAAMEHAHLLVLHSRDASAADLTRLLDAGWTTPGIVTVSQLGAFLAFQVRVVAGLRALSLSRAILAA